MGGYFGAELKYAGYDGIVVQGAAPAPCYLLVEDDRASLEDARGLWGQGTFGTQRQLKERHGNHHQAQRAPHGRPRFHGLQRLKPDGWLTTGSTATHGVTNLETYSLPGMTRSKLWANKGAVSIRRA